MPANNLRRDEAADRARLLKVHSNAVVLDLTADEQTFRSVSTITFSCHEPGASTFVELAGRSVERVTLNGAEIAVDWDGQRIALHGLASENSLQVEATCEYSHTGEGLHRFVDPADEKVYLYTQFETSDAHLMYACFDQPDLKASFELTVTAPASWVVVSNQTPDRQGQSGDGVWHFPPTVPMSTYITALVAGEYEHVHDTAEGRGGPIPLGIYVRASLARYLDAPEIFEVTKQGFGFFESEFDYPYAFGKYDQLFVPEFNAGAMENAGAVTFRDEMIYRSKVTDAARAQRANTILHEMAHMWFGDLVTMAWWDDLWLNESFAEFMASHAATNATRFTEAWVDFAGSRKAWGYRADQLPGTHPIAADAPDIDTVKANFDGITYAKGASVLRQLVAWVGADAFRGGLRKYFKQYAFGNTQLSDLLDILAAESGRDLGAWATEWLTQAGVNTLSPEVELDGDTYRTVAITQQAPADHPTLRSHRIGIGLYDRSGDSIALRSRFEVDVTGARSEISQLSGQKAADLLLVNDGDLTFAKIRLDPASLATATAAVGQIADPLARALIWAAAYDMTRDAQLRTRDFLAMVTGNIGRESEIATAQSVIRQVSLCAAAYSAPDHRAAATASLAECFKTLMIEAEAGGDFQLAFARGFISNAGAEDVSLLTGLLDGSQAVEGLAIDAELRWAIVARLALLGADSSLIDAEAKRDSTAAGAVHAIGARAARPTPEAKADAWSSVIDSDALPNHHLMAVVGSFGASAPDGSGQSAADRYIDPYFQAVQQIWDTRSSEMAQTIVEGLFPSRIDQSVVDKADAFLAAELPAPLRRLVAEGRDGTARALRAQACDAS